MSWDRDPLWAKARLFLARAMNTQRDDPTFGLWCSLGLELLARAALASISPALLAEPDREHKNLLCVVHKESEVQSPKSIGAALVFQLCHRIFPEFSKEDHKLALALLNRRNEELHSGAAAFDNYKSSQWLVGFYHACQKLSAALGETLTSLFGEDEAKFAERLLAENREELKSRILGLIAAYKKEFLARLSAEQQAALASAEKRAEELSLKRHHTVTCPACGGAASVQGVPFGKEHVSFEENGEIVVRQAISPTEFSCHACGLRFGTYAEVETAGLADPYTRTTRSSPEDYYGLINPDDLGSYVDDYLSDRDEYDNE